MSEQRLYELPLGAAPIPTNREPGWFDRLVPASAQPYLRLMRLDRPVGIWLWALPAWGAIALGSERLPSLGLLALFALEALLIRGMACTLNDILDHDLDAQMERTSSRPLASKQISLQKAVVFLVIQVALGLLVLASFTPLVATLYAISVSMIALYPMMKRVTWWPQAFLGFCNTSALLGWAALTGSLALTPILLYAGCVFWAMGFDTVYAHQDKHDDARIGVKSTALFLGAASKRWVGVFYALATLLWGAAIATRAPLPAALLTMLAIGAHFIWQLRRWNPDDPARCLAVFKSNQVTGWILLGTIVLARVLR